MGGSIYFSSSLGPSWLWKMGGSCNGLKIAILEELETYKLLDPWNCSPHPRGWNCTTWMSMEVIVTIVSKLVYNLLKGLITHLYRGEITQLLSTMGQPSTMVCKSMILLLKRPPIKSNEFLTVALCRILGPLSKSALGVVVSNIFYFHPYSGKWSNLTNIFQLDCNDQLEMSSCEMF